MFVVQREPINSSLSTGATAKAIAKAGGNSVVQECKTLGKYNSTLEHELVKNISCST